MTGTVADLAVRSLAGLVDLDVERTQYRGHARDLAAATEADLIIVHGGDGSVNEVVNGVMSRVNDGEPGAGERGRPLIAIIPGGGANVLARALGVPIGAAAAIRWLREAIAAGHSRTIGLGLAGDRYFTFSAGLGWDAEVVGEVDRLRARGRRESPSLFLRTMVRSYYRSTDRRRPALTLEREDEAPASDLFMTIITNRSPWTYLNSRAVLPVPHPDFSSGLDVLAMRLAPAVPARRRGGPDAVHQEPSAARPGPIVGAGRGNPHRMLVPADRAPGRRRISGRNRGREIPVRTACASYRGVIFPGAPEPSGSAMTTPRAKCDRSDIKFG